MGRKWVGPLIVILLALAAAQDGIHTIIANPKTLGGRESGAYLIILAILLICLTTVYLFRLRRAETGPGPTGQAEGATGQAEGATRWALIGFALLAAYIFALNYLGYVISTAAFMVVYMRLFGSYRWAPILIGSLGTAIGSAYMWAQLAMMLPEGILPWP